MYSEVTYSVDAETGYQRSLDRHCQHQVRMTDIVQHDEIQAFGGEDVCKEAHHAVALGRTGRRLLGSLPADSSHPQHARGRVGSPSCVRTHSYNPP